MGIIAVAGGTGDLGKTIVEQLVNSGKHQIFILTRKRLDTPITGTEALIVDYSNVEEMAFTLDTHNIDTVISTLGFAAAQAQLDLIAAADRATVTSRFIPSEFATYNPPESTDELSVDARRAADALQKSSLKYTRFANGIFMDYFGMPNIPTTLAEWSWAINIPEKRAAIPGTGNDLLSATYSKDVARFVERILDEEGDWPEYSIVSGSDFTLNRLLELAQEYTGSEFDVTYDSEEKLKNNDATLVSGDSSYGGMDPKVMLSTLGLSLIRGELLLPKEGRLKDKYPEVKTLSIEDLMARAWKKSEN